MVLAALLSYRAAKTGRKLTKAQRAFVYQPMAHARRGAIAAGSRLTSNHSDLHDQRGLPR
jgi:hypothetical protein